MPTAHLKNYIDGRWVDSAAGQAFEDLDPATGEVIATATKSTTPDVEDHAGAHPRQHRRLQAGLIHADARGEARRDPRGGRPSEGRLQSRARRGRRDR